MTETPTRHEDSHQSSEFADQLCQARTSLLAEFVAFLSENKKWWLTPIVVVLLLVSVLIAVGGSAVAPFIYTLF